MDKIQWRCARHNDLNARTTIHWRNNSVPVAFTAVPDVSVVLLNWNSYPIVLEAATAAVEQSGVSVELIIVDNGSNDESLPALRRQFPKARFIEMGFNSGFTGGMNAGTEAAQGEFVLWLNADLVLASDYCSRGVATMRADPTIGAVGGLVSRLVDGRRTDVFDAAGYTVSPAHRARFVPPGTEQDVVGVSGSCPLFRRATLNDLRETVGYALDPWYFAYGEDIDVMLRLNLRGWRVRFLPASKAWHVRSQSTVAASRFYEKPGMTQVHHFKNRLATIIKTMPRGALLRRLPALVGIELAMPAFLLTRRPSSVRHWMKAWTLVVREWRRLVRDRRLIQRTAPDAARQRLMRLLWHG